MKLAVILLCVFLAAELHYAPGRRNSNRCPRTDLFRHVVCLRCLPTTRETVLDNKTWKRRQFASNTQFYHLWFFSAPFQRLRFQFWSLKPSVNWATIISFLSRLFFSMHQNCNVFRRLIYPWLFGVYLCDIWLFQFRHFWEICSLCTKFLFEVWDM